VEDGAHLRRTGVDLDRLNRCGNANCENPSGVERLPQRCIIDAEVPCHRVDVALRRCPDALAGRCDLVEQGQHITGITRIALGHNIGKDKARGRLGHNARFTAKLRGAITFAFENRGNGRIVRIDNFTVTELFALREACRLGADMGMGIHRRVSCTGQARAGRRAQRRRLFQNLLGLLSQGFDRLSQAQELLFGVADMLHEDLALPPALAAKAPHGLLEVVVETVRLPREVKSAAVASVGDAFDEFASFFEPCTAWWHL